MLNAQLKFLKWMRRVSERNGADWMPGALRAVMRSSARGMQYAYHRNLYRRSVSGRWANLDDAAKFITENPVRVNAPLLLISQVQRSGGTLLSQLFDAHPALAAYPHELKFGYGVPDRWPELDPSKGPDKNFWELFDLNFPNQVRQGFTKGDRNPIRHRFLLIPHIELAVFRDLWKHSPPTSDRAILDAFFTAFFNAWLNYKTDLSAAKWITAFAPRLAHDERSMECFFSAYPDGRLIQILRAPKSWYPSARRHFKSSLSRRVPLEVVEKWCLSARSMLRNKERFGERVIILRFEDLVGRTRQTMGELSHVLGIAFEPVLQEPTFNGHPMHANSSFDVARPGVITAPLQRSANLSAEDIELLDTHCEALYREVGAYALAVPGPADDRAIA